VLGTAGEHIDFLALHSYPVYGLTYERYASSNPNMQARPPAGSAGQGAGRALRRARPTPSWPPRTACSGAGCAAERRRRAGGAQADAIQGAHILEKYASPEDAQRIRLSFTEVGPIDWGSARPPARRLAGARSAALQPRSPAGGNARPAGAPAGGAWAAPLTAGAAPRR